MNVSQYRKAIAAVVVPLVVFAAAKYGLSLDDTAVAALTALITGGVVTAVKNAGV